DGGRLLAERGTAAARRGRVLRRQPLPQPEVHRRARRGAALRRLQHERDRLEGGRLRLPAAVSAGQVDLAKDRCGRERRSRGGDGLKPARPKSAVLEEDGALWTRRWRKTGAFLLTPYQRGDSLSLVDSDASLLRCGQ